MSTHNICFWSRNKKTIFCYAFLAKGMHVRKSVPHTSHAPCLDGLERDAISSQGVFCFTAFQIQASFKMISGSDVEMIILWIKHLSSQTR